MKKETLWKLVPVIGAIVLVLGVVGMFVFSGKDLDVGQVITLIVAAAGALGLGVPALRNGRGGGSAAAGGMILLIAVASLLSGCGTLAPCMVESTVVDAVSLGVSAAHGVMPEDNEQGQTALEYADGIVSMGQELASACHESVAPGSVAWRTVALAVLRGVASTIATAMSHRRMLTAGTSVPVVSPVPPELEQAIELLEASQ